MQCKKLLRNTCYIRIEFLKFISIVPLGEFEGCGVSSADNKLLQTAQKSMQGEDSEGELRVPPAVNRICRACVASALIIALFAVATVFLIRSEVFLKLSGLPGISSSDSGSAVAMDPEKLAQRQREEELLAEFLLNPDLLNELSEEDREGLVRAVNRLYRDYAAGPQVAAERALNRLALLRLSLTRLAGVEIALNARLETGGDSEAIQQLQTAITQTISKIEEHALGYVQNLMDMKYRSVTSAVSCGDVLAIVSDRYAASTLTTENREAPLLGPRPLNIDNNTQERLLEILETHCIAVNLPSEELVIRAVCRLMPAEAAKPSVCEAPPLRQAQADID
jgi:hypothetical protein